MRCVELPDVACVAQKTNGQIGAFQDRRPAQRYLADFDLSSATIRAVGLVPAKIQVTERPREPGRCGIIVDAQGGTFARLTGGMQRANMTAGTGNSRVLWPAIDPPERRILMAGCSHAGDGRTHFQSRAAGARLLHRGARVYIVQKVFGHKLMSSRDWAM